MCVSPLSGLVILQIPLPLPLLPFLLACLTPPELPTPPVTLLLSTQTLKSDLVLPVPRVTNPRRPKCPGSPLQCTRGL